MFRRVLLAAGGLALVAGTSVGIASGVAAASPPATQFSGPITCAVTGLTHFGPSLVNGGSAGSTVKVTAKLKGCSDTAESGVTVTSGTMTIVSTTTVANNCGSVMEGNTLPTLNGQIKWKSRGGSVDPTTLSVTGAYMDYSSNNNSITTNLVDATTTAGSVSSGSATFGGLGSKKSGVVLDAKCGTPRGLGSIQFGKVQHVQTGTVTIQEGEA